jgi:hypothetical protein
LQNQYDQFWAREWRLQNQYDQFWAREWRLQNQYDQFWAKEWRLQKQYDQFWARVQVNDNSGAVSRNSRLLPNWAVQNNWLNYSQILDLETIIWEAFGNKVTGRIYWPKTEKWQEFGDNYIMRSLIFCCVAHMEEMRKTQFLYETGKDDTASEKQVKRGLQH